MPQENKHTNCSFLRRLAAIFYDSLLLFSVLFFTSLILIPLSVDGAIDSGNIAYNLFLLIICYLYFCWQWTNGGQTLGMRSWNIYVVNSSNNYPDWQQASIRFICSLLSTFLVGLGFLWSIVDRNKLALHDHLSKTRLVVKQPE